MPYWHVRSSLLTPAGEASDAKTARMEKELWNRSGMVAGLDWNVEEAAIAITKTGVKIDSPSRSQHVHHLPGTRIGTRSVIRR